MAPEFGAMGWFEHHSSDSRKAKDFYGQLFTWEWESTEMGDHDDFTALMGDEAVMGLIQSYPGLENYSGWLPYFVVQDVAASLEKAARLGGDIVVPLESAEGYGSFVVMKDPGGAVFALFQPDESDED
ncbi:MAG: VOC family protein [Fimbriimonadaceae bacterium]|jgi:hypothetical protein|nr:VOC family protein [Fimbriimonadaceae bacterium]